VDASAGAGAGAGAKGEVDCVFWRGCGAPEAACEDVVAGSWGAAACGWRARRVEDILAAAASVRVFEGCGVFSLSRPADSVVTAGA